MTTIHNCMKPRGRGAIFTAICAAVLALPLCADAAQINPADYECTFDVKFGGYNGTTTLTDFPALVRLSQKLNGFRYNKCADGASLRFADANGNLIPHEIDTWDASGTSLVWVKIPLLKKDTVITCYYGYRGSGEPPAVNGSDVWKGNGYVAVWHLGDANNNTQKDSTANGFDFVCPPAASGKVNLAVESGLLGGAVGFGGYNDGRLTVPDDDDSLGCSDNVTIEAWVRPSSVPTSNRGIMTKRPSGDVTFYIYANYGKGGIPSMAIPTSADNGADKYFTPGDGSSAPPLDEWTHMAFIRNSGDNQTYEYIDGAKLTSNTPAWPIRKHRSAVILGNTVYSSGAYPGDIDEVRFSDVARSPDWIKATRDTVLEDDFAVYELSNDWTMYSHKFGISFPGAPEATVSDFPVLVKVSEGSPAGFSYSDCMKEDGDDLRFADAGGNLLDSEVDVWDTNGVSLVWVKVPSLVKDVRITAYYGWQFAPKVSATNVWANGFLGVWHLGGSDVTSFEDSTGGGAFLYEPAAVSGSVGTGRTGIAGKAVELNLRSSDNKGGLRTESLRVMRCGADAMTIEMWGWQDDHEPSENTATHYFAQELYAYDNSYPHVYQLYEGFGGDAGKTIVRVYLDGANATLNPSGDKPLPQRQTWNHVVFRYDSVEGGANIQNGETIVSGHANKGPLRERPSGGSSSLFIGCQSTGVANTQYPGMVDEVRISSVARSDAWVKATYDTIKNNATFTKYGAVRPNGFQGLMIILR